MGNCLRSPTADDISSNPRSSSSCLRGSLLREGSGSSRDVAVEQEVHQHHQHQHQSQHQFVQQEAVNTLAAPVYYPSPNVSRQASQLTEEEQVKIAQRIGLIQHLPTGTFDGCKKNR